MTKKVPQVFGEGRFVLAAYRADLPAGGLESTAADNDTLLIATLLRQAVSATDNRKARERLISYAGHAARKSLGRRTIAAGCLYDRGACRSTTDLLRLVAERSEQSGRLNVAEAILEALADVPGLTQIDAGRLLADRARSSWKRGYMDLAVAQYDELGRRGRRYRLPELQARAWLGLAGLAQVRGNFPEMRQLVIKGLGVASRLGLDRLAANGELGLGVCAATAGDHSTAVEHFWKSYQLANGDPRLEPEILGDIAEVFRLANRPVEARAAARAVLASSPLLRTALPTLGVYAFASAALGATHDVEWSAKQVLQLAKTRGYARAIAGALFDCAAALEEIGQHARSGVLERRAEAVAGKHGFHDLTFRKALTSARAPRQTALAHRAEAAAAEIMKLDSAPLPAHLRVLIGAAP